MGNNSICGASQVQNSNWNKNECGQSNKDSSAVKAALNNVINDCGKKASNGTSDGSGKVAGPQAGSNGEGSKNIPKGDYGNLRAQYDAIMSDGNDHGFKSWEHFKEKATEAITAVKKAGLMNGDTALEQLSSLGAAFKKAGGNIFSFTENGGQDVTNFKNALRAANPGLSDGELQTVTNSAKFLLDQANNGRTDAQLTANEMDNIQRSPVTDDIENFMKNM